MSDVAAKLGDLFYERGTGITELFVRHDEDGFDARFEVPVHQSHVELELKIRKGAETADDRGGFLGDGEIHQQAVERSDEDVREFGDVGSNHGESIRGREKRGFAGVFRDGDGDAIEKLRRARKHIEMSVSDRVERPGVDAVAHVEGAAKGSQQPKRTSF